MSAVAVTRRMAFVARVERRIGRCSYAEGCALLALYAAFDRLALRAGLARAGYRLRLFRAGSRPVIRWAA